MDILYILVITVNIISILFLLVSLKRLRTYMRFISLKESKYTLVFGFVDMKIYVYTYVFFVFLYGTLLWFIIE